MITIVSTRTKANRCRDLWSRLEREEGAQWLVVETEREVVDSLLALNDSPGQKIADLNIGRAGRQALKLRNVKALTIFDLDVCQNYVPESDWYRIYGSIFRFVAPDRLIVSSATVAARMYREGVPAFFVGKAYDPDLIHELGSDRTVEAAFVGRVNHKVYSRRREFLGVAATQGVQALREDDPVKYNQLLNSIKVFVSADIGFDEYMIKNFEAMAAGCAVLAARQPEEEQEAFGFRDMENIALYSDTKEFRAKLNMLRRDDTLRGKVAEAGRELVTTQHRWRDRAPRIAAIMEKSPEKSSQPRIIDYFRLLFVFLKG